MEMHGTEIFNLVGDKGFMTKEEIISLVKKSFGDDVRFYTCAASDLTPEYLLDFFIQNGKFEEQDGKYRFFCESDCDK
jgi:probable metal-binding protein